MQDIQIASTQSTPAIRTNFADGVIEMRGDSYPENSYELFTPVLDWIEAYLREPARPLRLVLHLLYLNTSSVKAMMDIFDLLEQAHREQRDVSVRWYYDEQNERVAELAEEFREDCSFPFDILTRVE
ncbi:biofilm regulation phosphoprotein SiaC [Noviherbaspirillum aridicola]|uniref:SiaC family regulatory phosphoprotein domain-containing protein n=1 Tax=Noviherbaspirillum aridicola TaxID=2849687 RepID=A0ABQ4Q5H3_9BURK|nr:biofilm regulation phosphoprotein SiaC [Noviherbaspirillum aridicola]GIZ52251.1 hypothetical protein NCCP691_22650 [Noviherbaspirillum aridicola]